MKKRFLPALPVCQAGYWRKGGRRSGPPEARALACTESLPGNASCRPLASAAGSRRAAAEARRARAQALALEPQVVRPASQVWPATGGCRQHRRLRGRKRGDVFATRFCGLACRKAAHGSRRHAPQGPPAPRRPALPVRAGSRSHRKTGGVAARRPRKRERAAIQATNASPETAMRRRRALSREPEVSLWIGARCFTVERQVRGADSVRSM